MAGGGKSLKGRGGKAKGLQSTSERNSSQSSNPNTSNSSCRNLPAQYTNTQNSIPETQPFPPQPVRPQPQSFRQPPEQSHAPPPQEPPPPPQNHPTEDVDVDSQPPPQNQPQQEQLTLYDLLRIPGRENYLTTLDPLPTANTTWFDRDDGQLVRKISKLLKSKFDGAYYCWTKTPPQIQDRYFIAFAQSYHWDPMVTSLVRDEFNKISLSRMKDMVSKAKKKGVRPIWIGEKLWEKISSYWITEEAIERSLNASNARNSPSDGLGRRIHVSGQKSYLRIQRDMEKELGRPVSIGEVFIRTHTRRDGTFVDPKSKQIAETYEKNLEDKMSEIMEDPSDCSSELTTAAKDNIFLQSTVLDERGREYGLGSLGPRYGSGKRKGGPGSSTTSIFSEMQEQLLAAQRQIEEQAAENAQRHAEWTRLSGDQRNRIGNLEMVLSYLQSTDPRFSAYVANHILSSTASASGSATPAAPITTAAPAVDL